MSGGGEGGGVADEGDGRRGEWKLLRSEVEWLVFHCTDSPLSPNSRWVMGRRI